MESTLLWLKVTSVHQLGSCKHQEKYNSDEMLRQHQGRIGQGKREVAQ